MDKQIHSLDIFKAMPQDKVEHSVQCLGGNLNAQGIATITMQVSPEVVNRQFVGDDKQIFVLYVIDREAYEATKAKLQEQV
ncbi:MAG: hypothetical protein ACK4S4_16050 [Pyrinomonadaceae bacterium]